MGTLYQFSGTPLLPIGQLLSKEFTTQPTRPKIFSYTSKDGCN